MMSGPGTLFTMLTAPSGVEGAAGTDLVPFTRASDEGYLLTAAPLQDDVID